MKRIGIVLAAFVFTGAFVYTQESVKSVISDGNLRVLDRVVERSELWDLPLHELRVLRNTIFAKYGYIFRSTDLRNHFAKFPWYRAEQQNVDSYFSPIDKENIERIQYVERSFSGIVTYQDKMLSWIVSEAIPLSLDSAIVNGVRLYQNPALSPDSPERKTVTIEFADGDSFQYTSMFCFAAGRFLTPGEIDAVGLHGQSLVFNPALLFLSNPMFSRSYGPFRDSGIYLIAVRHYDDSLLNTQVNQIKNGSAKSVLILPWSVEYTLYKIAPNGTLQQVDRVVAN